MSEYLTYDAVDTDTLERWLLYGLEPGGLYKSILTNDLYMAAQRLHPDIKHHLADMTKFVVYHMPRDSYGSEKFYKAWRDNKNNRRERFLKEYRNRKIQASLEGKKCSPFIDYELFV
jgi:siroheme synthase (precorrin-2 oxidase/ferrochelatase)